MCLQNAEMLGGGGGGSRIPKTFNTAIAFRKLSGWFCCRTFTEIYMVELTLFCFCAFYKSVKIYKGLCGSMKRSSNTLAFIIDKSHQNFQNTSETLQKCSYEGPSVLH